MRDGSVEQRERPEQKQHERESWPRFRHPCVLTALVSVVGKPGCPPPGSPRPSLPSCAQHQVQHSGSSQPELGVLAALGKGVGLLSHPERLSVILCG